MNKNIFACRKMQFGLLATVAFAGAGLAMANSPTIAQEIEEVVVTAPRVVHQTIGRSPSTGAAIEIVSISRNVHYSDLNLSKPSDAAELENRIKVTAKNLCTELDKLYPLEPPDGNCVKKANDDAMEQARKAIAAASR